MVFKDSYFIMAEEILSYPEKQWSTLSFKRHDRNSVVSFFKFLVQENILNRQSNYGRNSACSMKNPQKLLDICINAFKDSEKRSLNMISNLSSSEIIDRLRHSGYEFYCGGFSGIRNKLKLVSDNHLKLLFINGSDLRSDRFKMLQMDCSCFKSSFGGNVTFSEPKFKNFLKVNSLLEENLAIPSDFYTYLSLLAEHNPLSEPQIKHYYDNLGGVNGNFLAWL